MGNGWMVLVNSGKLVNGERLAAVVRQATGTYHKAPVKCGIDD